MHTQDHQGFLAFHKSTIETDSIYQKLQKNSGLSDAEFWSFVAIRLDNCQHQHEICKLLFMSKQTVNTALKQLIKRGFISQTTSDDNQRIKYLSITKEGETFARCHIDIVREVEQKAWQNLSDEEQHMLLHICQKLNRFLDTEIENVINNQS